MSFHPNQLKPRTAWLLAALLAMLHAWLALLATVEKSNTSDEIAHITGGYTFNKLNDYRLHPENGILTQRIHALPLMGMDLRYPDLSSKDWSISDVWLVGHAFLFETGNPHREILWRARAINTVFGIAVVLLVFAWSSNLFGPAAGLFSAALAALCPTLMAHSAHATSDVAITFFLLASLSLWWRWLRDGGFALLLLSVVVFSLAAGAKYSSALLLPFGAILAGLRLLRPEPLKLWGNRSAEQLMGKMVAIISVAIVHGAAAWFTLWAICGFRFSMFNPELPGGVPVVSWEIIMSFGGWKATVLQFCRDWRLAPEAIIYGFSNVLTYSGSRSAFLNGEWNIYGWKTFFPYAFLVKTPPAQLLAFFLGAASLLFVAKKMFSTNKQALRNALYDAAPLIVLFVGYWITSIFSHLNIGHRHILPTYPPLFILAGAIFLPLTKNRLCSGISDTEKEKQGGNTPSSILCKPVVVLGVSALAIAGAAWDNIAIRPHYLAYFNTFAGGPENGWKHLVDSSLDWGQDLPGLKAWLDSNRRPDERVYFSYFGTSEPAAFGIEAIRMPSIHSFGRQYPWYFCEPGIYAISATLLQVVYFPTRGPWTKQLDVEYQVLRGHVPQFRRLKANPNGEPELLNSIGPEAWTRAWDRYNLLRFLRLTHYLRARGSDANAGYSILIYRLSAAELSLALDADYATYMRAIGADGRH